MSECPICHGPCLERRFDDPRPGERTPAETAEAGLMAPDPTPVDADTAAFIQSALRNDCVHRNLVTEPSGTPGWVERKCPDCGAAWEATAS